MYFDGPDCTEFKQYIECNKSIKNGFNSVHVIEITSHYTYISLEEWVCHV